MTHCVITGAADGIGLALARRFAALGYDITGIDRDRERGAEAQAELGAEFIYADLTAQADIAEVVAALRGRPAIDVLVHNAGISAVGRFAASDLAAQQAVYAVNLLAPMYLTAGVLDNNLLNERASIVFVSSLSHYLGYPGAAVYAATKDGLASYARSLRVALGPEGIHVLTVYPGPTRTAHARRYSPDNSREASRMPPEDLAQQIVRAVQRRQRRLIPGATNKLMGLVGHLWPGLGDWVMRRVILDKLDG